MSTGDHNAIEALGPRLASRIVDEGNCWRWTGRIDWKGYGWLSADPAHRLTYEAAVGPIPAGLVIDHLCRNPWCVNPAHLEPVTQKENVHRGIAFRTAHEFEWTV